MVLTYGGKVLKSGNTVLNIVEDYIVRTTAVKFPTTSASNRVGIFKLGFTAPTTVTINFGNGDIVTYNTVLDSGVNYVALEDRGNTAPPIEPFAYPAYSYPDATSQLRLISIQFDKTLLSEFTYLLSALDVGDFLFEFAKYPALRSLTLQQLTAGSSNSIVHMNFNNAAYLPGLTSIDIGQCFNSTSPYFTTLPEEILHMPLTYLQIGTSGLSTVTFAASHMDEIVLTSGTLQTLILTGIPFVDNNFGNGPLPSNFSMLTNLRSATLTSSNYTTIPPVILGLSGLTSLSVTLDAALTTIGDVSALTNLVTLATTRTSLLPTLPASFSSLVSLKTWTNRSYGKATPGQLDVLIDNIYTFIVANAAMTGANTLPFRGWTVDVTPLNSGDGTQIPSGTFQQPSGYVQGSSNGSPISSQEEIWVMVNQYGHTWAYRTI